jgi:hypothetical protein
MFSPVKDASAIIRFTRFKMILANGVNDPMDVKILSAFWWLMVPI